MAELIVFFNCDIVRHWQLLILLRSDVSVCKEKDENNKIERLCRVTVIKSLTIATTDAGSWIHVHVKKSCWFIFSLTIWILCLPCHDKHWQRTKHIVWATINRCSTYYVLRTTLRLTKFWCYQPILPNFISVATYPMLNPLKNNWLIFKQMSDESLLCIMTLSLQRKSS